MTTTAPTPMAEALAKLEELAGQLNAAAHAQFLTHWPGTASTYAQLSHLDILTLTQVAEELGAANETGFYDPNVAIPLERAVDVWQERITALRSSNPAGWQWLHDQCTPAGIDCDTGEGFATWERYEWAQALLVQVEPEAGAPFDEERLATQERLRGLATGLKGQVKREAKALGVPDFEGAWTTGHLLTLNRLIDLGRTAADNHGLIADAPTPAAEMAPVAPPLVAVEHHIDTNAEGLGEVDNIVPKKGHKGFEKRQPKVEELLEWAAGDELRLKQVAKAEAIRKGDKPRKGVIEGVAKALEALAALEPAEVIPDGKLEHPQPLLEGLTSEPEVAPGPEVDLGPEPHGDGTSSAEWQPAKGQRFTKTAQAKPRVLGLLPAIDADESLILIVGPSDTRYDVVPTEALEQFLNNTKQEKEGL